MTATLSGELAGARIVDFPLRGEWVAVHTPASRIPSHGTDMLGQRYAFDIIRFDARKGSRYYPVGSARMLVLGVRTLPWLGGAGPCAARRRSRRGQGRPRRMGLDPSHPGDRAGPPG